MTKEAKPIYNRPGFVFGKKIHMIGYEKPRMWEVQKVAGANAYYMVTYVYESKIRPVSYNMTLRRVTRFRLLNFFLKIYFILIP